MFGFHAPGAAADPGGDQETGLAAQVSQSGNWIFAFTTYGGLLGLSGDMKDHDSLDCYLGYRALPVGYSQGAGDKPLQIRCLIQGPFMGAMMWF